MNLFEEENEDVPQANIEWQKGKQRQLKRPHLEDEDQSHKAEKRQASIDLTSHPAKDKVPTLYQIKLYEWEVRELLDVALTGVRIYLQCRNAYPSALKQRKLAKKIFRNACKQKFGSNWKGIMSRSLLSSVLMLSPS